MKAPRHVVQAIAVEQDGPARAERDAKPSVVAPPDLSQRPLGIRFARQRRRDVLRENGNGHRRDEIVRAVGDAIDVARNRHAGLTADPRRRDGRRLVDVVHMEHARGDEQLLRELSSPQRQPLIAIPHDDALAGVLVDEDDRELIGDIAYHDVG
jgi:hypothetical protein